MSVLGNRVLRREDPALLTGQRKFVDDLRVPGMGYVTYVRSTSAHAIIAAVETAATKSVPGVLAVITAEDLDLVPANPVPMGSIGVPDAKPEMARPWLADGVTRFVGEPIAAVVTEELSQGIDACELIEVEYRALPSVIDPREAVSDQTLLFPEAGTNVVSDTGELRDDFFDDCEVVVSLDVYSQRLAPSPIEPRGALAQWDENGRLTFWTSTQTPHAVRHMLSESLHVDASSIHVITPAVGGGFGAKGEWYHDQLLVAWLSRHVGRPLKWTETRSESMTAMIHGRAQWQGIEIGGSRGGLVKRYRLNILQDVGAYPGLGAMLPSVMTGLACGPYAFEKVETSTRTVVTNTTPVAAYRGAGRPEMTDGLERAMDSFAAEIGIDPVELRRRNLIPGDAFPYQSPAGMTYDSGNYQLALDMALELAGYDALRMEQAVRRANHEDRLLGIGVATYVELAGSPTPEFGALELSREAKATLYTGTASHGQGHATSWAMIVSERTGIPMDDIEVIGGDTDLVPHGVGTFGSRSAQSGGVAAYKAADALVDKGREIAAELLEAGVDDVVLDASEARFHVVGSPAYSVTWSDVALAAGADTPLRTETFNQCATTFPFGSHIAVVEIDSETGMVTLERFIAVDDAGRLLNPLIAEGQIHGGVAQGIGQALFEHFQYDSDGSPLTASFIDYLIPSAAELPGYETSFTETPTPHNPLGVKGVGESGTVGATAAVHNAVVDALSHLGIRHVDMPATPEKIWTAIREATQHAGPGLQVAGEGE